VGTVPCSRWNCPLCSKPFSSTYSVRGIVEVPWSHPLPGPEPLEKEGQADLQVTCLLERLEGSASAPPRARL
jgi:hypothetical protein